MKLFSIFKKKGERIQGSLTDIIGQFDKTIKGLEEVVSDAGKLVAKNKAKISELQSENITAEKTAEDATTIIANISKLLGKGE